MTGAKLTKTLNSLTLYRVLGGGCNLALLTHMLPRSMDLRICVQAQSVLYF